MDPADVPLRAPQILIQVLLCLNQARLKRWDCGLWDEAVPPSALREIITTPGRYRQAIQHINKIHRKKVWFRSNCAVVLLVMFGLTLAIGGTVAAVILCILFPDFKIRAAVIGGLGSLYKLIMSVRKWLCNRILRLLAKAVGRANALLCKENVLIGYLTNAALVFVYVPLDACRDDLGRGFDAAVLKYSCAYVRCLALGQMPSKLCSDESGHLQGAWCFCQFVQHQKSCCC